MIPCDQAVFLPIFLLALQLLKRHGHDTNPVFQIGPQLNLLTQPDQRRGEVAVLDVSCPLLHILFLMAFIRIWAAFWCSKKAKVLCRLAGL